MMEKLVEKESVSSSSSKIIPDSVMEAVKRTSKNIDEFSCNWEQYLPLYDPHVFSQLGPLQKAQSLLLLAKTATTLFALRLRCKGLSPDDHPVKSEFERLNLYQEKLQRCVDLDKAPLRPSATINPQAAARFIEHSLPDLTPEQKKNMRVISKGEGTGMKYLERIVNKKRKYQSPEKQSVQTATQEFLEKAARELLGENQSGLKGPLQLPGSDNDDLPMT